MAKYKIVVSDLHLGRGRVLPDGSVNILEDFLADRHFAEFLDHYSSGKYYDAEVELILNGDILNLIQVDYRGYFSPILTESISAEKLRGVIKGHKIFFDALKRFAQVPHHKIVYVVGNHDVDMIWPECKKLFAEAAESPVVFRDFIYVSDGVHVEHGHQYETVNRLDPKKIFITKGLKEPIINLPWGSHFVINYVIPVKIQQPSIDKVRPIRGFVRWMIFNNFRWAFKNIIRIGIYFIGTRFSKSIYRTSNLVTTFRILKELSRYPSLVAASRKILQDNPDVYTVIMGHTHTPKYRQFEDGRDYINAGTWTEVTSLELDSLGNSTKYSYVLVDYTKSHARPHAYLREWRGRWHEDVDIYVG